MVIPGFLEDVVPVDRCLSGLHIDVRYDKLRIVCRKRRGPEEFAVVAVEHENAAGFTDGDDNIVFLAGRDCGIDPLHGLRIGADACAHQRSFMREVGVPVVGGQMLVVPGQFPGVRIQRDCRIAVEI